MMQIIEQNLATAWFLLGFALLAVEIVAFGMASGILLFTGIGALITGGLLWFGVVPDTWLGSLAAFSVSTLTSAVLLWKPLKRMQARAAPTSDRASDLIGHTFRLEEGISLASPGTTRFSGIQWRVEIDAAAGVEGIEAGEQVEVVSVDAGLFRVRPSNG